MGTPRRRGLAPRRTSRSRARRIRRRRSPESIGRVSFVPLTQRVSHVSGMIRYTCPLNGPKEIGGERGIRTLGRISPTHAFQACSFNHSDIYPFRIKDFPAPDRGEHDLGPNCALTLSAPLHILAGYGDHRADTARGRSAAFGARTE